jgi:dipeptidase E
MIVSKNLKIVAAGRGRSMSLPSIAEAVLSLISATTTSFNLVYTATYDKDEAFLIQTEAYRKLPSCQMIKLDVSEAVDNIPSEQETRDAILSAHAILVSGGNTLYAINRWKELKIDQFIRQAVEENQPVLCGGSAGAICWFDYGHSDSMDPTTFLHVDPNLTEEQKSDWEYIR